MNGQPSVFLSYATDTKAIAEELAGALQAQHIQTWVGFELSGGDRWPDEIERAAQRADWFVLVVSPESVVSQPLESEWRRALMKVWTNPGKRMLPVVVGDGDPPMFLRGWLPVRVDPDAEPGQWPRHVLEALRSRKGDNTVEPSEKDVSFRQERFSEMERAVEEFRCLEQLEHSGRHV